MNEQTNKTILLALEIGPVVDFISASRKTADYWAGSYIFSYIMGKIAHKIEGAGGTIISPDLKNNPLYTGKDATISGSIPDRIFATIPETKIDELKKLQNVIPEIMKKRLNELYEKKNKEEIKKGDGNDKTDDWKKVPPLNEIDEYFYCFYVLHDLNGDAPTFTIFNEAETKLALRGSLRQFEQLNAGGHDKWKRCSLCWEREGVHTVPMERTASLYQKERICCVCLLKRYFRDLDLPPVKNPRYESTSDIAGQPILDRIGNFQQITGYSTELDRLNELKDAVIRAGIEKEKNDDVKRKSSSTGRYFFDESIPDLGEFREKFNGLDKIFQKQKGEPPFVWLKKPYFAIVQMDGDNLSDLQKNLKGDYSIKMGEISKILSEFSLNVHKAIKNHDGMLIYAGGDDVSFLIHPDRMLECIAEIQKNYFDRFADFAKRENVKNKLTMSAGAIVCPHKYPLSKSIRESNETLEHGAKAYPGKGATAIKLVKGGNETLTLTLSIDAMNEVNTLRKYFEDGLVSRTTAYRLERDIGLLTGLEQGASDDAARIYITAILEATRGKKGDIKPVIGSLMKIFAAGRNGPGSSGARSMIDALLYARFLTGGR